MKISTKGRYSLKIMLDICKNHSENEYITLKEIAEHTDISEKYLESIVKILVRNDLLLGLRGKGGGYKLTKAPSLYSVGEILRISEENFAPVDLHLDINKDDPSDIKMLEMFEGLDAAINNYLDSISLNDLLVEESGDLYFI